MNNHDKKRSDKKLTDITVKDVERFVAKYIIGVIIGLALLMLILWLIELLA